MLYSRRFQMGAILIVLPVGDPTYECFCFAGLYNTYIYVEDDTGLHWSTLVSWALDQQVLEPLGFSRGFYRTEVQFMAHKVLMMHKTYGRILEARAQSLDSEMLSVG